MPEMSTLPDKEENGMCDIKPALHPHPGYQFKPSVKIKGLYCGGWGMDILPHVPSPEMWVVTLA